MHNLTVLDEHLSTLEVLLIEDKLYYLTSFFIFLSHLTDTAELVQFVLNVLLGRPLSLQIQVGWQTDLHGLGGRGGIILSLGGHNTRR